MAEVSQRLWTGAQRLSSLRSSRGRVACTGEKPGAAPASGTDREEPAQGQSEAKQSRAKQAGSRKVPKVRASSGERGSAVLHMFPPVELDSLRFIRFIQSRESLWASSTALNLSAGMSAWTRGAVSIHPDSFRSPQQLRTFCTIIFISTERTPGRSGSSLRLRPLKPPLEAPTTGRSYSWRRDSSSGSQDVPPLFRSRTAYYDILKVSPGATQAQIKTAYYKQSFIYHPDKNPGSDEATLRFSEVSEAYTVLGNIHLRRKYDRGILSQSDLQGPGKPSKGTGSSSRSTGSSQQQQQQQQRTRTQPGGRPIYDFDAFYRAHYGEQLQREREMKARRQRMQEEMQNNANKLEKDRSLDGVLMLLMAMGSLIIISLGSS